MNLIDILNHLNIEVKDTKNDALYRTLFVEDKDNMGYKRVVEIEIDIDGDLIIAVA